MVSPIHHYLNGYSSSSSLPPLPDAVPLQTARRAGRALDPFRDLKDTIGDTPVPASVQRTLREGCYLASFTPLQPAGAYSSTTFDGTFRVQRPGATIIASGDLYLRQMLSPWSNANPPLPPSPAQGIPVFPRSLYRYYLRVVQISEGRLAADPVTLVIERHVYSTDPPGWTVDTDGPFTAEMRWTTPPSDYPPSSDYFVGELRNP